MSGYASIPTARLQRMWERERDRLLEKEDSVVGDYDALLAMRSELDRRKGDPKPSADVNFADEYLTD